MKINIINKINYYSFDEINDTHPKLFSGCKTKKSFLDKHNISTNNFIHARLLNNKFSVTDGKSRKFDKLFIRSSWFDKNLLNSDDDSDNDSDDELVDEPITKSKDESISIAPEIIELKDSEKFKDNDGNILDIEVRGTREVNKCYFKVKDIMIGFGLKSLNNTITNNNNGYYYGVHYINFYFSGPSTKDVSTKNNKNKSGRIKKLFLTYKGLLRVLFASRGKAVDRFVDWATYTLFTAQMGTSTQKNILAANLLGIDVNTVKEVFKKSASSLPCTYLLSIGKVANLKKSLDIGDDYNDDDFVIKWGMTDDFKRRLGEHQNTFSKIKGSNLEVIAFNYIDPQFVSKAESDLKKYFKDTSMKLDIEKHDELAIVSKKKLSSVKNHCALVGNAYAGHAKDLIIKLKEKDHEIELIKKDKDHEIELIKKGNELLVEKHKNELLVKDLEIANMKLRKK